jgi:hypothetical protein
MTPAEIALAAYRAETMRAISDRRSIWCCNCQAEVQARLTTGGEVYPHRADLAGVPVWRCDGCKAHVGCHWRTKQPTRPLGVIPSPEIKEARKHLHALIDPIWQSGRMKRGVLYARISTALGREYHTAELRCVEEARHVWRVVQAIKQEAARDA